MKNDPRNIYLRNWREKRKNELEALRAELARTREALTTATKLIDGIAAFERPYSDAEVRVLYEAYAAALARLAETRGEA